MQVQEKQYKATYDDAALTIAGEMHVVMPERYQQAVSILKEMNQIDECKDVVDRMEALAIYWKQTNDEEMENLARRLRVRAYRRVGELLKEFDARGSGPSGNRYMPRESTLEDTFSKTQSSIAEDAGLSKKQQVTAVRLATIPQDSFEEQIEAEKVPTITKLADQAIKKRVERMNGKAEHPERWLKSVARKEHNAIEHCLMYMKHAVNEQSLHDPEALFKAAYPEEREEYKQIWQKINEWMERFVGVK